MKDPILRLEDVSKSFGGLQAVDRLSFEVQEGEILGFIGPNGAGKTTVFNLITGIYRPDRGRIVFRGQEISGWPPYRVVNAGIARTFQIPRPFRHKTIAQNVEIATIPNELFSRRIPYRERLEKIATCCARTGLCSFWGTPNGCRAGDSCRCGQEFPEALPQAGLRKLELAKALATDPTLLLLDEPFAGLAIAEMEELSELLRKLREERRTLIVVDHNMRGLMKLVDRVVVIHFGHKLAEGLPQEIAQNPLVQQAYLSGAE